MSNQEVCASAFEDVPSHVSPVFGKFISADPARRPLTLLMMDLAIESANSRYLYEIRGFLDPFEVGASPVSEVEAPGYWYFMVSFPAASALKELNGSISMRCS